MTEVDEFSALTESIGEHVVQAIGRNHLDELSIVVSSTDCTARIAVGLTRNTEAEQRRALEKLFDVQELFFDEVSMTFTFGPDLDLSSAQVAGTRQYSMA